MASTSTRGLVAVNAVVTEEVFGEVLDKNLCPPAAQMVRCVRSSLTAAAGSGRLWPHRCLAYLLLARTSLMRIRATAVIGRI